MLYVCLVPGKEKMRWYLDWIRDQLLDLNVDIRLNHAPTVDELRGFDVVLNATGAALVRARGRRRRVARRAVRGGDGLPEGRLRVPPGRPEDAQARRARAALGRRLRRDGHRGVARRHREAGHDRDREPRVRRGVRGHPHVRPAQALRAGRRRGPPLAAVQAPGDGDHEHDRGGDPRRRGRPPGQRTSSGRSSRSTTWSPATRGRSAALFAELRAAGVHVLNVGDSVRPRNLYHAVKEGLRVRARRGRAPAVQLERRDPRRPADRRPRPAHARRGTVLHGRSGWPSWPSPRGPAPGRTLPHRSGPARVPAQGRPPSDPRGSDRRAQPGSRHSAVACDADDPEVVVELDEVGALADLDPAAVGHAEQRRGFARPPRPPTGSGTPARARLRTAMSTAMTDPASVSACPAGSPGSRAPRRRGRRRARARRPCPARDIASLTRISRSAGLVRRMIGHRARMDVVAVGDELDVRRRRPSAPRPRGPGGGGPRRSSR